MNRLRDARYKRTKVESLMASYDQGVSLGRQIELADPTPVQPKVTQPTLFRRSAAQPIQVVSGPVWQLRKLRQTSQRLAAEGTPVLQVRVSPTALFHRRRFHADGYWLQTGGLFGRAKRTDRLVQLFCSAERSQAEAHDFGARHAAPAKRP